jgi:hypothetical protein
LGRSATEKEGAMTWTLYSTTVGESTVSKFGIPGSNPKQLMWDFCSGKMALWTVFSLNTSCFPRQYSPTDNLYIFVNPSPTVHDLIK